MSRIYEIAKEAGVSITTVSRVFNKRPYVREAIRKKVLEVAGRLEYVPKFTARKDNIFIVIDTIDGINLGNYEDLIISTVTKYLVKSGLNFEIVPISEIGFIRQNFAEGAIAIIYGLESVKKMEKIKKFPVLTINCPVGNFHSVYSDHKEGVCLAMEYLVERGHRKIAIFLSGLKGWGEKDRLEGYKESIKKFKLEFDERLIQVLEKQTVIEAVAKTIKMKPTSLIICGEDAVLPVTYALNLLSQRIPDDISIISFENKTVSPYLLPPHTTISQPFEEIGRIAVEKIKELKTKKGKDFIKVKIGNSLVERESVKRLNDETI